MKLIRHSRLLVLAVLAALSLLASACGSASEVDTGSPTGTDGTTQNTETPDLTSGDPIDRLDAARSLWSTEGPTSYTMTVELQCFCPQIKWKNIVRDGEVESTESVGEDQFMEPRSQAMEDLFDEVESVIRDGYFRLDLEFDTASGALANYWVDVEEMMADEEHGVIVTVSAIDDSAPEPEPSVPATAAVDASAIAGLQDDYGCGFGFAKGNADQTLALIIYSAGGYSETGPDLSSPIVFPSDEWVAEVQTGSDLFANWCDDVMEEGEPIPEVTEVWTVVSGTLTATITDAPNVVEGTLTDLVIESSSGEQVQVAEIVLLNTGYGFFAG
jgi:hypothetical protein